MTTNDEDPTPNRRQVQGAGNQPPGTLPTNRDQLPHRGKLVFRQTEKPGRLPALESGPLPGSTHRRPPGSGSHSRRQQRNRIKKAPARIAGAVGSQK